MPWRPLFREEIPPYATGLGGWKTSVFSANEMTDMTVSNTILSQIGGNRFKMMTGAKTFIGGSNYLSFRFPQRQSVNYCKITLNYYDTYDMEFAMIRNKKGVPTYTRKEFIQNVYNDALQEEFSHQTGLYTSL